MHISEARIGVGIPKITFPTEGDDGSHREESAATRRHLLQYLGHKNSFAPYAYELETFSKQMRFKQSGYTKKGKDRDQQGKKKEPYGECPYRGLRYTQ
ncbi:hypothetical protein VNO78_18642 [Psophocarpus tetragonolobus]|uniref:Uncharacterized protein n=1 Tax=Psophocarpus tetragonolobus TaxID=3891 RepID=A0AAN9XM10_PSOTE